MPYKEFEVKLGIQKMPEGYKILQFEEGGLFYLRLPNGDYADQGYCVKWDIYYWAKQLKEEGLT